MLAEAAIETGTASSTFPLEEVRRRLEAAIRVAADEDLVLGGSWEPCLDSLSMVSALITLEDLFKFQLPPECVVRRGGYSNAEEGIVDMAKRCKKLWDERYGSRVQT